MNFITFVSLCLVASVLVIPQLVDGRSRRSPANSNESTDSNESTASTTAAPSSSNSTQCGTDGGLAEILGEVGNLLGNLLNNVPLLGNLGLTKPGGLLDLVGLLIQVQKLLNALLTSLKLGNLNLTSETGLIQTLLNQITTLLNNLLGGNQGNKWRCENSGGSTGGALGRLVNAVGTITTGSDATNNIGLITLVNFLLQLVGALLGALNVGGIVGSLGGGLGLGHL